MVSPLLSAETASLQPAPRLCLFGAAGDTTNLGVSALQEATVRGILGRLPSARLTVFDHGRGSRRAAAATSHALRPYELFGAYPSRRVYRQESWAHIRAALRLPRSWNPAAEAIRCSRAVLDISGGDSFSDIYGLARFRAVAAPKRAALAAGVPLVLLPQTYGPFQDPAVRAESAAIVRGAASAWARDADSFDRLRELLGEDFDADRHRCGIDVAFALDPDPPEGGWPEPLGQWLTGDRDSPVVGLNVSGLVYFARDSARQFGISLDYRALMSALVQRFLERTDARIVLVPHVTGRGGVESDPEAIEDLTARTGARPERVALAPTTVTAGQIKDLIGRLDWFCGARMHACIAALSSGVPTTGVAYSLKTRGVFDSVGQASRVLDARAAGTAEALERLWADWEEREETRRSLAASLPDVRQVAARQMDQITSEFLASDGGGGV